jgi:hypothetical protein
LSQKKTIEIINNSKLNIIEPVDNPKINLIPETFGITFDSLITKLNAYFIVDYYVVYEILCKYTKLIIILLCLITLHTNLKFVDDYLLLFSKKINKKIVNKTKKETFNNLEKQEVNKKYISKRVRRDRRSFDCDLDDELDDEYLTESDKFTPKHNYPKSNVEKLLITIILLTFLLLLSAPL